MIRGILLTGHRGFSSRYPNTLQFFRRAERIFPISKQLGARMSVIFHSDTIPSCTFPKQQQTRNVLAYRRTCYLSEAPTKTESRFATRLLKQVCHSRFMAITGIALKVRGLIGRVMPICRCCERQLRPRGFVSVSRAGRTGMGILCGAMKLRPWEA